MHDRFSYMQCVHYRSSAQPCAKGVDPKDVTDGHGRVPCCLIRGVTGAVACDMRLMPPDAVEGAPGPATEMLNAVLAGLCPKCHGEIRSELEMNGSIVALPCRHVIRSARDQ